MSTDGDIEIAVKAEGVDEAAADLAEGDGDAAGGDGDAAGGVGVGGDGDAAGGVGDIGGGSGGGDDDAAGGVGGGGGGGGGGSKLTKAGSLIGVLLALLGPVQNVLKAILGVLNAFLAPVALLLLRLFQPVLRELIKLLPAWFNFVNNVPTTLDGLWDAFKGFVADLPGMLLDIGTAVWEAFTAGASWLADGAAKIGEMVWDQFKEWAKDLLKFFKELPGNVADALDPTKETPSVSRAGDTGSQAVTQSDRANIGGTGAGPGVGPKFDDRVQTTEINLNGTLPALVQEIERSSGFDLV